MLRTHYAWRPCSATTQNVSPFNPFPTLPTRRSDRQHRKLGLNAVEEVAGSVGAALIRDADPRQ
jgi:hypothetical protein